MIDLTLSDEQQLLRDTARRFAREQIVPVAARIARDASLRTDPWSICRPLYAQGVELGFTRLLIPQRHGGLGRRTIDAVLAFEELGAADISIAADYFALNATVPLVIVAGGSEAQREQWLPELCSGPALLLAGALSEPNVAGSELFCPTPDPALGIRTYARREGAQYLINGQKSAFVTNGGIADRYVLLCRTNLEQPQADSISIFYLPAATAGLRSGKRTEMIGWHASHHAEVLFDAVRVEASRRIGEEGAGLRLMASLAHMPICLAACFVGLARAAYELALDYANNRRSWGVPIRQHQAIALKLADMYADVQAARLTVWDAALALDTNALEAGALKAPLAKTAAVDAAIRNAQRAVEILGGYGITTEYAAGRYLQDAWIGYACDFTRDLLRLGMAQFL
ncbi:MAG TPA: acyl-CoA dehydrogenase family protein [Steroidobacteraceae bacterium]|nr:acyl-CoA dehydrogenase family protein [Steroidobacteraceae bacterium]